MLIATTVLQNLRVNQHLRRPLYGIYDLPHTIFDRPEDVGVEALQISWVCPLANPAIIGIVCNDDLVEYVSSNVMDFPISRPNMKGIDQNITAMISPPYTNAIRCFRLLIEACVYALVILCDV